MIYVELIAKPNTWYKTGSEVLYDGDFSNRKLTLEQYQTIRERDRNINGDGSYFRGIRIVENPMAEGGAHLKVGDEREDGEWCSWNEFEIIEIEV